MKDVTCQHCQDGHCPTDGHIMRRGRAHYVCIECGRDVTLALFFISLATDREEQALEA